MKTFSIPGVGDLQIMDETAEIITNPFSGESIELEPKAIAVYDFIKGAEMLGDYKRLQIALSYFSKHWPSAYMILLD